jgi:hypothetical protein
MLLWAMQLNDRRCSGSVEFTNFPSQEGITPKSQAVQIPNPYNRQSGPVSNMEWSSDGYVLAVGWRNGWAIFSVGGRCLAWGFGVPDSIDEERCDLFRQVTFGLPLVILLFRFQDSFMHGILDLVSGVLMVLDQSILKPHGQFWAPGNFELIVLAQSSSKSRFKLFYSYVLRLTWVKKWKGSYL